MKKLSMVVALILTATLVCGAACAAEPEEEFAAFEEYGRVLSVEESETGAVIEAEGYFGYHMDEDPSMTVKVEIGPDCLIHSASVTGSKAQTEGFAEMITQEYMDETYVGAIADPLMSVDAVSGATATSQAVCYAVQTAGYYVQNALGYVPTPMPPTTQTSTPLILRNMSLSRPITSRTGNAAVWSTPPMAWLPTARRYWA